MKSKLDRILLFPFALAYGLVIRIRNLLFDTGIIKSTYFALPVITVGNLTVGGTGKTPHVEYLLELLKDDYNIAVLSRGYKRRTKNFNVVETDSGVDTTGDEPLQIKCKYPGVTVAVDRNRVHGINEILSKKPETEIIILDDAYQHRYVEAGLSILLIDYNRLITNDYLLPAGRLREPRSSVKRANIVLITKSPPGLPHPEMNLISEKIQLSSEQHLFYTCLSYDQPLSIFEKHRKDIIMDQIAYELKNVLLVTGIAEPGILVNYLNEYNLEISHLKYRDHHRYNRQDCMRIRDKYLSLPEGDRCLITTEKDAIRLKEIIHEEFFPDDKLFFLRINIVFINNQGDDFNKLIKDYVRKNRKNSIIS